MWRDKLWTLFTGTLLEYETQKVVQIHSKKVGGVFRLIQVLVMLYVIIWVMIWEKGYQKEDKAQSGVTAKLKGIAYANLTDNPTIGASVWDAADYVIPPQQKAAFFVMTNLIITPGQSMSTCEESHDVYGNTCRVDSDCEIGSLVMLGSGVRTGYCINSTRKRGRRVCEVYGWCPTEYDVMPEVNILSSAPNFTVILKNSIEFPMYKVKRRNILPWMDKKYLYTCRYDPNHAKQKFCPIFKLSDILKYSGADNKDIWRYGGMISIQIEWNCNLDFHYDNCVPAYTFRRLDDFKGIVGKGWNFRYSQHYTENGVHKRNLIKAYGIQFFIEVYGSGGKFDVLTFTMNLGSGLALLGIATVLCDMIVLNLMRKRDIYRNAKVDLVVKRERAVRRQRAQRRVSIKVEARDPAAPSLDDGRDESGRATLRLHSSPPPHATRGEEEGDRTGAPSLGVRRRHRSRATLQWHGAMNGEVEVVAETLVQPCALGQSEAIARQRGENAAEQEEEEEEAVAKVAAVVEVEELDQQAPDITRHATASTVLYNRLVVDRTLTETIDRYANITEQHTTATTMPERQLMPHPSQATMLSPSQSTPHPYSLQSRETPRQETLKQHDCVLHNPHRHRQHHHNRHRHQNHHHHQHNYRHQTHQEQKKNNAITANPSTPLSPYVCTRTVETFDNSLIGPYSVPPLDMMKTSRFPEDRLRQNYV